MPRVSFHRLAERELNDAALYYEHESSGLGFAFLDEVEAYVESIVKNPNVGTKIRGQVRRRLLRRFPLWNSLFSKARPDPDTRDYEPQKKTDLLGRPVLKGRTRKGRLLSFNLRLRSMTTFSDWNSCAGFSAGARLACGRSRFESGRSGDFTWLVMSVCRTFDANKY